MWYLFAEREGAKTQMFESDDHALLLRHKTAFDHDGWTTTILDETERARYRHLTAQLVAQHPDLAV